MHLFTLIQLLSLQHSVPLAGLLWLSKIRLHCPPHLTMGIHCFYTARLSTDSFICGVNQLAFAVGGHRGNSTLAYRGAATTPRYPPPVYKAPHGHQNNRSLTTLRVCLCGLWASLASLRAAASWGFDSQKHLFTRNPQFLLQHTSGMEEDFFHSVKGQREPSPTEAPSPLEGHPRLYGLAYTASPRSEFKKPGSNPVDAPFSLSSKVI